MKVVALNRALTPSYLEHENRNTLTGICKIPVTGPIHVGQQGLDGDIQVDRKNHGGPDKAVYVYSQENYRYWDSALNTPTPLEPGVFGENLTVTAMPDAKVHIGDTFRIGGILVQVTQPRVPCFKLGLRMGDPSFVATFLTSGRAGFYLRVLEEGDINQNDAIICESQDHGKISIEYAMQALLKGPHQIEVIQEVLSVNALSAAWRQDLEKRLDHKKPPKETP